MDSAEGTEDEDVTSTRAHETTLTRYPALRLTARIYRVLGVFTVLGGVFRLLTNVADVWPSVGPATEKGTAMGIAFVAELLVTAMAAIMCFAISDGIAVLAEINDRGAAGR